MEGFLQSLKFANPEMQQHVCGLVGIKAKSKGRKKRWQVTQTLYWRSEPIARKSNAYQKLLDRAYNELFKNTGFRNAIEAAAKVGASFTHSIGKNKEEDTVLTEAEFCSRLTKLKDYNEC
tara:strand:+ start:136 stop:495 length:360 start_codon:yes stop_codon:yes gene_type:complete